MSTQTRFDLTGLSHAIQDRDCRYHLALYAADAQVEILDAAHADAPLQVLHGKPAISEWLNGRTSAAVHYEMKDAAVHADRVTYTEECRYADGSNLRFECNAQVHRGQITHARVRLIDVPLDGPCEQPPGLEPSSAYQTLGHQSRQIAPHHTSSRQQTTRNLPGNFLG